MQEPNLTPAAGTPRQKLIELLVLSMVALYVELLIIRWMSADIRAFTIFRTFPLVTCFVGLGAGFAIGSDRAFKLAPLALSLFVLTMKVAELCGVSWWSFPSSGVYQWGDLRISTAAPVVALFMVLVVVLLAGPFFACASIGSRLGVLFNQIEPLKAYLVNLTGSLLGSVIFTGLCYVGIAPAWLLVPAAAIISWYLLQDSKRPWNPIVATAALIFLVAWSPQVPGRSTKELAAYRAGESRAYWSPYQRLDLTLYKLPGAATVRDGFLALELSVNRLYYQYLFNAGAAFALDDKTRDFFDNRLRQYDLPFAFNKARDVLIVGAGTGQNVATARDHGVTAIDAVEIDPQILHFGKVYNPAYSDPGVRVICDDARHFFNVTRKKYDLILFGLLDSHAVVGQGSSVRVDTYVYTTESFVHALRLLKPGGLLVVSFCALAPWMKDRLAATMREACGYAPIAVHDPKADRWKSDVFYILGDRVKEGALKPPPGWEVVAPAENQRVRILTDDWPYLYVQPDIVDIPYFLIVAEILAISILAARRVLFSRSDASMWQMFFLGAAFMLLELHAISRLSLLFGSTWLTSAIAINGIIILIMIGNLVVMKSREWFQLRLRVVYAALFLSIAASYTMPASILALGAAGQLLVTVVTLSPMGIAGMLFACLFAPVSQPHRAMAFNLLGAVVGGLLEYLSNYVGIRGLELVAAGLYFCSWLCSTKFAANLDAGLVSLRRSPILSNLKFPGQ